MIDIGAVCASSGLAPSTLHLVRCSRRKVGTQLGTKLAELEARRDEIDHAITRLRHALACTAPSPMECPTFLAQLDDVLPVDPERRR